LPQSIVKCGKKVILSEHGKGCEYMHRGKYDTHDVNVSIYIYLYSSSIMIAKQIKKKNGRHAATSLHNIVYRTITAVHKLITIIYKKFYRKSCRSHWVSYYVLPTNRSV